MKLLEPLAQALGISLVELIQGKRQEADTLTVAEADAAVSQAMGQSEKTTARRYLRLFRWCLTAVCGLCLLFGWPLITYAVLVLKGSVISVISTKDLGVIGGADGPTAIITASAPTNTPLDMFLLVTIPLLLLIVCIVMAVKVWRLEKKLK